MVSHYCDSSFQTETQNLLANEKAHLGGKRIKKMARGLLWLPPHSVLACFPAPVAVQLGVLSAAVPEVGGSCVAADSSGGHDGQHVTWESSPGENSLRGFGDTQLAVTQPPPCRLGTVRGDS